MPQMILGTGRKKGVRPVVTALEREMRSLWGVPRKIVARTEGMEITAERPDFGGEFESFQVRARLSRQYMDAVQVAAQPFGDAISVVEENAWIVVLSPPVGTPSSPQSKEALDAVSAAMPIAEVWRVTGDNFRLDRISPELLFQAMVEYKASDVHLSPGESPVFRVDCQMYHSEIIPPLSAIQIQTLIHELAGDQYWLEFEETKQTSFSYHQVGIGYARVSAFMKCGAPHCTFRFLPESPPLFDDLNVPKDLMLKLASLHRGLLLVTGMTGSGKTTTVASLVNWINANKMLHILTIENPIEYVHHNKKSLISQRNLGPDVNTFREAVTGALRHDPDVIVIGEMRDPDTIRAAINAAATGHLVISTLHSNTAYEVVNRIVSFFDPIERDLVRQQLRDCLQCVICQRLAPREGGGRIPSLEVLFNDIKPINDAILEGDTEGIRVGMQQTVGSSFIFEKYLYDHLFKKGLVSLAHAQEYATDQSVLDQMHMGTYSVPRLDTIKSLRNKGD